MIAVLESIGWQFKASFRALRQNFLVAFLVAFAVWLIIFPLIQLFLASFDSGTVIEPGDWTLVNYTTVYGSEATYKAFVNTFIYAVNGTLISVCIGVLFGFLIERTDLPLRNIAWALLLVPVAMPGILFAMGWIYLLHPNAGFINIHLRSLLSLFGLELATGPFNIHSLAGLIFLDGIRGVTTVFLIVVGGFRMMDPALEESARASGASIRFMLRKITLPLLMPAILAGAVYSFMVSLDSFELPIIIGLPERIFVFSTLIYFSAQGMYPPDHGFASAFATCFFPISLFLIYLNRRFMRAGAQRFSTITGKGYRPHVISLGKWRYPAFSVFIVYSFFTVLAPFLMLVWASLLPSYEVPSRSALQVVSLSSFARVLGDSRVLASVANTLLVTVATATLTMFIALGIAWVVVRSEMRGRGLLDAMSFLPQAIPSVVIAIALIFLYSRPPLGSLPIYGTVWVIVLGLTTSYLAFGSRTMNGAIVQVSKELEEAACVSGAGRTKTLLRITLPLVLPAFMSGWIWVAAHAMRAFSIPLILASHDSELIAVRLWDLWETGDAAEASALGVLFILILSSLTMAGRWLVVRLTPQQ
jgi:iron(III) transport system permease protein